MKYYEGIPFRMAKVVSLTLVVILFVLLGYTYYQESAAQQEVDSWRAYRYSLLANKEIQYSEEVFEGITSGMADVRRYDGMFSDVLLLLFASPLVVWFTYFMYVYVKTGERIPITMNSAICNMNRLLKKKQR